MDLPDEVLLNIMMNMDYLSLSKLSEVDSRFRALIDDEIFWRDKLSHDYNVGVKNAKDARGIYDTLYTRSIHNDLPFKLIDIYYGEEGSGYVKHMGQIAYVINETYFDVLNDVIALMAHETVILGTKIWFMRGFNDKSIYYLYEDNLHKKDSIWRMGLQYKVRNSLDSNIRFDELDNILIEKPIDYKIYDPNDQYILLKRLMLDSFAYDN